LSDSVSDFLFRYYEKLLELLNGEGKLISNNFANSTFIDIARRIGAGQVFAVLLCANEECDKDEVTSFKSLYNVF
jgi:hypothetical protein